MFTKLFTVLTAAAHPAAGGAVHVSTELADGHQFEGHRFESGAQVAALLRAAAYLPDNKIATVVHLGDRLGKPVLVEGPAGTGPTELAMSVPAATGARLIRLQC